MSFSTTRAIITPSWCRNGLRDPGAGSSCISSRPIVRSTALNPIERLWGLDAQQTSRTTNATPACAQFADRDAWFPASKQCPGTGRTSVIQVTDNFRVINPKDFRVHDVNGVYRWLGGAPRSMKMGTIASPWRYDGLSPPAKSNAGLAAASRKHYAENLGQAASRFVARRAGAHLEARLIPRRAIKKSRKFALSRTDMCDTILRMNSRGRSGNWGADGVCPSPLIAAMARVATDASTSETGSLP